MPRSLAAASGYVDIATTDPKLPTVAVRLAALGQAASVEVCVEDASGAWVCNTSLEAGRLTIISIPTSVLVRDGQAVSRISGVVGADEYLAWLKTAEAQPAK